MKTLIQSIVAAASLVGILSAAEPQESPDLRKAFPTEKLEVVHKERAVEWYLFETNLEFVVLKDNLLKFLGKGWAIVDHDKDKEARFIAEVENQGELHLAGMAIIKNSAHPNVTVSLHLTEHLSDGGSKKPSVSILRSDATIGDVHGITLSKLTRSAAETGNAWAQRQLGFEYFTGRGVEKDLVEAVKWWRKSAEQGDALSQFGLAGCYLLGHGVPEDHKNAVLLFRKAADQGLPDAHYALATCYDSGKGVEPNEAESIKHYLISAKGNYARAQFNLGVIYYLGKGVEKDPAEAYAWLSLSNSQGWEGKRQLEDLEQRLPPETIKAGKKRAGELAEVIAADLTTKKAAHEKP